MARERRGLERACVLRCGRCGADWPWEWLRCVFCGFCVEACPKGLFTLMPEAQKLIVQCRSLLEGG